MGGRAPGAPPPRSANDPPGENPGSATDTDTIHNVILFKDASTMLHATKLIP